MAPTLSIIMRHTTGETMKNLILPALCLSIAVACGGSTPVPLDTMPRTPAAIGVISVEQGPNDNTIGKLHVEHLAPPQRIRGDLGVYVAWVRAVGADEWQNVGQLLVDESREGDLEVRVPHQQFEFTLSAESNGDATYPSKFVVMQGQVDARVNPEG
jgi:hypothetical protein